MFEGKVSVLWIENVVIVFYIAGHRGAVVMQLALSPHSKKVLGSIPGSGRFSVEISYSACVCVDSVCNELATWPGWPTSSPQDADISPRPVMIKPYNTLEVYSLVPGSQVVRTFFFTRVIPSLRVFLFYSWVYESTYIFVFDIWAYPSIIGWILDILDKSPVYQRGDI